MLTWGAGMRYGVLVVVVSTIGDDGAVGGGEDVPRGVGNLYGMGCCWEGCCSVLWVGLVGGRGRRWRTSLEDVGGEKGGRAVSGVCQDRVPVVGASRVKMGAAREGLEGLEGLAFQVLAWWQTVVCNPPQCGRIVDSLGAGQRPSGSACTLGVGPDSCVFDSFARLTEDGRWQMADG